MRCPLCDSDSTASMKIFGVSHLVVEWMRQYQIDVGREFKGHAVIELWRCSSCTFEFFRPEDVVGSEKLYGQLEKNDWYYIPKKWEHEIALQDLKETRNALEVGCGAGGFLEFVAASTGIDIVGLELNTSAIRTAQAKGLNVRCGTAEELATEYGGFYDAVCSFQVLEHVQRPREFLKACCQLLRKGGRLILGLPNADSFLQHQFNLLDMPPHHMSRWRISVLQQLPCLFPLKLVRTELESLNDLHVDGYVEAYARGFGWGLSAFLSRPSIRYRVAKVLRHSGVRGWLRGQTTYVCYERV